MMQSQDEYNECLNSFNNNKDNCNHLKYKYNYTAQDYVNEADDFWLWNILETESGKK